MANYSILINAVSDVIKENGNEDITGQVLQDVLLEIIRSLGAGYLFRGVAAPDTDPGQPDGNVFYLAYTAGQYEHFGGVELDGKHLTVLVWSGEWAALELPVATSSSMDEYYKKPEGGIPASDLAEPVRKALIKAIPGTYDEIKALRDSAALIPGVYYRITDYIATTKQPGSRSANIPFDIIVLALTPSQFAEDAHAIEHEGNDYFSSNGVNPLSWSIKYCFDNDGDRFFWAEDLVSPVSHQKMILVDDGDEGTENYVYIRTPELDEPEGRGLAWGFVNEVKNIYDYVQTEEENIDTHDLIFTQSENPRIGEVLDMSGASVTVIETSYGYGVIYEMTDENDNTAPFDFKGIKFLRDVNWQEDNEIWCESVLGFPGGDRGDLWFFLFSWLPEDSSISEDSSVIKLADDAGVIIGVHNNYISSQKTGYIHYDLEKETFILPNMVIVESFEIDGGPFWGEFYNIIEGDCYYNSIGGGFQNNRIEGDFTANVICYNFNGNSLSGFNSNQIQGALGCVFNNFSGNVIYDGFSEIVATYIMGCRFIGTYSRCRFDGMDSCTIGADSRTYLFCFSYPGISGASVSFTPGKTYPQFATKSESGNLMLFTIDDLVN